MRVMMTIDAVGGVFTHAVDLIAALGAEDVAVSVVVFGPRLSVDQRRRLERAAPVAIHDSGLALEWMEDPWGDLERAAELLAELERVERPDVVHANAFFCGTLDWRAPLLIGAHSCVRSWWRAVHGIHPPASWNRYSELVRAGLMGADAVVAPSAAMAAALEREYGIGGARVIHNGSAAALAPADTPKEACVLAAGRVWDPAKNLATLAAAAGQLRQPVYVAGGDAGDDLEAPGASAIRPLGQLSPEALAAVRRRAAVFAAPALYEPFGLAILEAARDACALVLGDIPSLRELWEGAATFVPPRDEEQLAARLRELLEHPERASALGARAQLHAARYSVTAMAEGYRRLYRSLLTIGTEVAA